MMIERISIALNNTDIWKNLLDIIMQLWDQRESYLIGGSVTVFFLAKQTHSKAYVNCSISLLSLSVTQPNGISINEWREFHKK